MQRTDKNMNAEPQPTPPSAEAMAAAAEIEADALHFSVNFAGAIIDRHFAPLREKITGLKGLNIQNDEIIHTLTDDRDALRKRVDELKTENKEIRQLLETEDSLELSCYDQLKASQSRITALQATVQASEGDKRRLDWLCEYVTNKGTNGFCDLTWSIYDEDGESLNHRDKISEDEVGEIRFDRACIDAALATHSDGEKTT